MAGGTWVLWGWLAVAAFGGDEPDRPEGWWRDVPVSSVTLSAPEGGLPDENLQPLLRAAQDRPLVPADVRTDLATLYRVGRFSAVEAQAQPWFTFDAAGNEVPAVRLTYVMWPAPVLARVRVQGNRAFASRKLLDASGLATGQVFYEDLDAAYVAERVRTWMRQRGHPEADVQLRTSEPSPGRIYLVLLVDEGPATIVSRLAFAGPWRKTDVSERQLRRWARHAGVREGRALGPDDIPAAQDLIRERLGSMRRGLTRRRHGYTSARVTPTSLPGDDGQHVTFVVEPGPRLELDVEGMGLRGQVAVQSALGIDHRLRLTGGFLDQAPELARTWLQERGWYDAVVDIRLAGDRTDPVRTLFVRAERGARHTIGDIPDFKFRDFDFHLTDDPGTMDPKRLARDLQAVFDQTSPDVLRREYYTDEAMAAGAEAASQYLVGGGHLEARVSVLPPVIGTRRTVANVIRRIAGAPRRLRVRPQVQVTLGPVTTLADLEIVGMADDVPLPWLDLVYDELTGAPFSPQKATALARRLIDAHRAEGYLEADARVTHTLVADNARQTVITITPGPLVRLRSIVTRNRRLTRRQIVVRTVDLQIGEPIRAVDYPDRTRGRDDPRSLEEVRADLYDLGVFRTVTLELLGDGEARDLVVAVNERPRTSVELGGGFSTDQGVRTFLRFTQRNLFGLAHRVQVIGQVGLDYRSENVRDWLPDITRPEGRAAASYTAPRFPGARQQLTFDVTFRERRQERTLRIDRSGGGASVQAAFGRQRHTVLTTGARVEARRLNQFDPAAILVGEPWATLIDPDNPSEPTKWRMQSALTALLLHDLRDDPIRPTRGALFTFTGEYTPGLEWPGQERLAFIKTEARVSGSVPLGAFTLRLAGGGGRIVSLTPGVAPVEDRFRLGGTGSLRGFRRDGVGPQNIAIRTPAAWPPGIGPVIDYSTRNDPDRWVPTGGDTVADGTLELIAPLPALGATSWEGYAAAVFIDVGNVWFLDTRGANGLGTGDAPVEPTSNDPIYQPVVPFLRVGVGLGARVDTPVGPLQIDFAVNPQALFAQPGSDVYNLLKTAWEEPGWRFHLTLGSLF